MRRLAWLFMFGLVFLASPLSMAKKRVVVLGFDGPQAGKAEAAVAGALKKKFTVVSAGQFSKAQKKLNIKKLSNANLAKVASEIQVDAVITGAISRAGAKWNLTLTVREGASGKPKGKVKIALRAPAVDARAKTDISAKLVPLVAKTKSVGPAGNGKASRKKPRPEPEEAEEESGDDSASDDEGSGDEENVASADEEEEKPKKGKKSKKAAESEDSNWDDSSAGGDDEPVPGVDEEATKEAKRSKSSDDEDEDSGSSSSRDDGDDSDDGGDSEPSDNTSIVGGRYARHGAAELDVGISAIGRTLTFTSQASLLDEQQPNGYAGAIVPGGRVAAALYPFAFGKPDGGLSGLGFTFVFDRVLGLKSRFQDKEFATTQQQFGVGVRYRLPFGKKPTLPTLHFGVGYNSLAFAIDSGSTPIGLPNVTYTYLDPGVGIRLPLGTAKMALLIDARYMMILGTGDMSLKDNYGAGSVVGIDADAGIEIRITERMPLHVGVRYQRMAYDFDGTGKQTNRDDKDDQDVGGALDVYMGGYATIGYIF